MSNSTPGLVYNQVPTAGQWNSYFGAKQDWNAILDAIIAQGGAAPVIAPAAWTPTDASAAALTFTSVSATATVLGNILFASARLTYPTTSDTTAAEIGTLPFPVPNIGYAQAPFSIFSSAGIALLGVPVLNSSTFAIYNAVSGAAVENVTLSGKTISFRASYPLS